MKRDSLVKFLAFGTIRFRFVATKTSFVDEGLYFLDAYF